MQEANVTAESDTATTAPVSTALAAAPVAATAGGAAGAPAGGAPGQGKKKRLLRRRYYASSGSSDDESDEEAQESDMDDVVRSTFPFPGTFNRIGRSARTSFWTKYKARHVYSLAHSIESAVQHAVQSGTAALIGAVPVSHGIMLPHTVIE